ncbi:MAG TPA: hypothetical protein VLY87_01525 [Flavobacterium sp.]|nr:hypothetical protein [Flavobacterium sp.]
MKKLSVLLLSVLAINTYAQNTNCTEFVQTEFINKIKHYQPTKLLPYSIDGNKWSLMDLDSKKIVIDSLFESSYSFTPNLHFFANSCEIVIFNDYSFKSKMSEITIMNMPEPKSLLTTDALGFSVDENGKMTSYSKTYKKDSWDSWNISKAIKHHNEYFAIVHKQNEDVLINQKGEEQENFRFKTMKITPYKYKSEILLYVNDFKDKHGFITLSGKKILYGKLMRDIFYSNSLLGYSVQHNGNDDRDKITKSGVLDLTTQKWLIKPQKKYKIYSMIYTSSEKIEETEPKNRNKANVYFLATENDEYFVIDINGKVIKPKL